MIDAGDVRDVLPTLESSSVQCVVTSPPYWGLRDYGVQGQIGLEPTLDAYVETMVGVFREVRRVLAEDGVCWLNLGDSYVGSWGAQGRSENVGNGHISARQIANAQRRKRFTGRPTDGLKPKDLCLMPARVALALQADGWYVRSEIIWAKGVSFRPEWSGSVMPESVKDRPTRAHETVWLMTKSARYFYDAEAVSEAMVSTSPPGNVRAYGTGRPDGVVLRGRRDRDWAAQSSRNLRDVWAIDPQPFPGAHFATFPQKLVDPMIRAGSSDKGVCPECRRQWVRKTEKGARLSDENYIGQATKAYGKARAQDPSETKRRVLESMRERQTIGWAPACECGVPPARCTVLDPFAGSGTTGIVAKRLSRNFIGIELSPEYVRMAREQIEGSLFAEAT